MNKELSEFLNKFNSQSEQTEYQSLFNFISNENELTSKIYKVLESLQNKLIKNQSDIEDTSAWDIVLTNFERDTDLDSLSWTVTGGGAIASYSITNGDTLTITPIADANGSETITFYLTDNYETVFQQVSA